MTAAASRKMTGVLASLLIVLLATFAVLKLKWSLQSPLIFDDSYMFYRYAMHLRQGLGMSWNLDAVHTYGETAPLWGMVIFLVSFVPLHEATVLITTSWIWGMGAIAAMAWAVARHASSDFMKQVFYVLPLVFLPLVLTPLPIFLPNSLTGMETMMATALVALFLGLAMGDGARKAEPVWAGLTAVALFLTRPESALAVVLFSMLSWMLGGMTRKDLQKLAVIFFAGAILDLIVCRLYFHTALPLSFYMKNGHAYEGYHKAWHPLIHALVMFADCGIFLAILALLTEPSEWRFVAKYLVPAVIVFAYLCTITQIMGGYSRYFVPYFPFFVLPALLVVDRRLVDGHGGAFSGWFRKRLLLLGGGIAALVCVWAATGVHRLKTMIYSADTSLENRPFAYEAVELKTNASVPLPTHSWYFNIHELGDVLLARLPDGATIAASEVGYLGAANYQANVIDLEGLNDTQIALHGFNAGALLARKPDIIWMPHTDYTYQRGLLLTQPELLKQYDVYAGVGNYDLALRKDSPIRAQIDVRMKQLWQDSYPNYSMDDYLVRSISWSGKKYRPGNESIEAEPVT